MADENTNRQHSEENNPFEPQAPAPSASQESLAKKPSRAMIGIIPSSLNEAWQLAQQFAKSSVVPARYIGKPQDILAAVMWGAELRVPPMAALRGICVINGTPALFGDLFLSLVTGHPDFEDMAESFEGTGEQITAVCTMRRRGREPVTRRFGVEDAKTAGLWMKRGKSKDGEPGAPTPWVTHPKRMLQMRARGFAGRDLFPDALSGLILREEAMDIIPGENPGDPDLIVPRHPSQAEQADAVKSSAEVDAAIAKELGHKPGIHDFATGDYHKATTKVLTERDAEAECRRLLHDVLKADKEGNRYNEARISAVLGRYKGRAAFLLGEIRNEISHRESGESSSGSNGREPAPGGGPGAPEAGPTHNTASGAPEKQPQTAQPKTQQGFGF